jgi:GDP/UDP-N,N'-diacetylbacillosamine 2-epimerase (hydrolysing)
LMQLVREDKAFELQILATGAHLSPEFGMSYRDIEAGGFHVTKRVEMLLSSDTAVGVAKSMGLAQIGFADAFSELAPDLLVVLGDRYEILSAVAVALVLRIPVAHLHGGEITEGAYDNSIRHAITKMSHLHFTSTELYRQRVIQMGENPGHVFNVGAIGVDNIRSMQLSGREDLETALDIRLRKTNFLVTFHPATLQAGSARGDVQELLAALDQFPDAFCVFTKSNADTEGRLINACIEEYVQSNPGRAAVFSSLGQLRYLSLMKLCSVVIGNSSSGIIEAPSLRVPSVNIGMRQKGRVRAESVVDCGAHRHEIVSAIKAALGEAVQEKVRQCENPYGHGGTAERILATLRTVKFAELLQKTFYTRMAQESRGPQGT